MKTKNVVGVMDSGVGGLTILKNLVKLMPKCDFAYFGDTLNLPYGSKTKDEILNYNRKILNFFLKKDIKTVVIACNTTSALTYEELKKEFEPKGMKIFPLIQSIAKEVAKGLNSGDCVCVLSTKATADSGKYGEEIRKSNPNLKVVEIPCSGFVEIVENCAYNQPASLELVEQKMQIVIKNSAKRVVLGCTHYPYLIDLLSKFAPTEIFFNPSLALAQIVSSKVSNEGEGRIEFFVTKNPQDFVRNASFFFDIKDEVKLVELA